MKKRTVVIDTNVLISAVLFDGVPRRVLELLLAGKIICCLSIPILDELRDVLLRPKFGFSPEQAIVIVEELRSLCRIVRPSAKLNIVHSDPDDNMVLECAVEAKAGCVVSGDGRLTSLHDYQGIAILSPRQFLRSTASFIGEAE